MTNKINVITYLVNLKGSLTGQKNIFIINRDLFEYISSSFMLETNDVLLESSSLSQFDYSVQQGCNISVIYFESYDDASPLAFSGDTSRKFDYS